MRLTPGLSLHRCHPEFRKTLQYDMANGLTIDFVSETGRWEKMSKREHLEGDREKGH